MWDVFLFWVATTALSYLLRPEPEQPKPAALKDFNVPTADEARDIMVIFGTCWVPDPNCVWYGDLRAEPIPAPDGDKK